MRPFLLIFLAGGCGSLMRYAVAGWAQRLSAGTFPFGTLAVNLIGCAVIGFLATLLTGPVLVRGEYQLALLVGLLGGFTTFSSYGWETVCLAGDRQWWLAIVNILANNLLGLGAAWLSARLAVRIYGS